MKKSILIFVAIVMMAGFSNRVLAQSTLNTTAGAVIITPIALAQVTPLHFGVMGVNAAGTCVLSTTGVRTKTGGVNLSASVTTPATNAAYNVTGQASTTYVLTLPATITVTKAVTLETMTIGTLLARFNGAGVDAVTSTLSAVGADSFTVGGTLTVGAAQVAGTYAGSFDVTVAYN